MNIETAELKYRGMLINWTTCSRKFIYIPFKYRLMFSRTSDLNNIKSYTKLLGALYIKYFHGNPYVDFRVNMLPAMTYVVLTYLALPEVPVMLWSP